MAMILIKKEEITEDGEVYIVETYQSGKTGKETVVKYPKPSAEPPEPIPEPPLTEQEQIAIDTALNAEYIACLMEASLG